MTDKPDSSAKPSQSEKTGSPDEKSGWSTTAIAGAAIGSAALAAALLFATRRRDKGPPVAPHPEDAPETD